MKITLKPVDDMSEIRRYDSWFDDSTSGLLLGSPDAINSLHRGRVSQLVWKMVMGDEVLGVVKILVSANIGKLRLAVNHDVRRRGVGSALVRETLKLPEIKELRRLEASVPPSNTAAQKILKKNGFSLIGNDEIGNLSFRLV